MKYSLLLVLLCSALSLFAQTERHLPFQGKLLENGQAVNGERTFTFNINESTFTWSETHQDVIVINGLYNVILGSINPLPEEIFKTNSSHQIEVLVEGNLLDEVSIFAPIENDPTVPDHLKDGVDWGEISGVPDLSNTNGASLDNFQVGQFDTVSQIVAGQIFDDAIYVSSTVTQEFVPNETGLLKLIQVKLNNTSGSQLMLRLYKGSIGSSQFIQANYVNPTSQGMVLHDLVLQSTSPLIAGEKYTFEIEAATDIEFAQSIDNDPYPYGISSIDPDIDLVFKVNFEVVLNPKFVVKENGDVQAPSGRLMDKTGYVAFAGKVDMFAGPVENIPEGWLPCEGQLLSKHNYQDLYNAIGDHWGDGNGNQNRFRIPDLRSAFVRGWDAGTGKDPDANSRYAKYPGGASGDQVGSYQNDTFKNHNHNINHDHLPVNTSTKGEHTHYLKHGEHPVTWEPSSQSGDNDGWSNTKIDAADSPSDHSGYPVTNKTGNHHHTVNIPNYTGNSGDRGGNETRSYNASVIYIIKY